ncbi:MAG: hypothetical protein HGA55_03025 [Methanoregulaceae archaeon]|nr:hypothetical protein [Methanoregulaceae archaeon]
MLIWEIRHKQWEVADAISLYLKEKKIAVGQVHEIIRLCGIRSEGHFVGKFLQRSSSMPNSPFIIRKTAEWETPGQGIT